jgi:ATP-binding cassette subfamily F protein uup
MALISLQDVSIGFRGPALLDSVSCQIERGQRIGLLGRNGAGKTTFLRILCGEEQPDSGELQVAPGVSVSLLRQDVPRRLSGRVSDIVAQGWHARADAAADEYESDWRSGQQVKQILSRMDLDAEAQFELLSSGMKRRVLLAQTLVSEPDILLLDEPTNHLDIDAISWLENLLLRWQTTLVFVTHDRVFLRKMATRILEIDSGRLFDWSCDYGTFLQRKAAAVDAQQKQDALFDKRLAQEEAWIRQGIKARRTRNEGRVRALQRMRQARRERQDAPGKVSLRIDQGQRSGALVIEAKDVSFAFDDRTIVREFSTTIMRGDKVGVIGPNGAGKTTLLRILLGQLTPDQGQVRLGTNLQVAYFDQLREQLDDEKTVQENVGDGSDSIQVGGKAIHVIGYLQDFLFTPERARTQVRFLSGGERNRILLARLFAKPANMIVLDEPTNDLDTETLELLEERLVDYAGTLLLVSHDRAFLNNVVTSTIVFDGDTVQEFIGGYDDSLRQRSPQAVKTQAPSTQPTKSTSVRSRPAHQNRRLSYKERRELDGLPATIEQLEADIAQLHTLMADPTFYRQPSEKIATEQSRLNSLEEDLATAYSRWEQLEDRESL